MKKLYKSCHDIRAKHLINTVTVLMTVHLMTWYDLGQVFSPSQTRDSILAKKDFLNIL